MISTHLQTVNNILADFSPISLSEMDNVKLMDRTDSKFALSFHQLGPILQSLSANYRILTINQTRVFSYRTDYFDTQDLDMFRAHHNGKLNRFKIRQREYIESKLHFLEVKFKNNKGRVIKDRIERTYNDQKAFSGFVHKHTPYNPDELNLSIINLFNRFTLVDNNLRERVTIDFNLAFSDLTQKLSLHGLVVVEVKQNKASKESTVFKVLHESAIRPASISKYCLGVSLLNQKSKFNNFKKTIIMINKLSHVELSA